MGPIRLGGGEHPIGFPASKAATLASCLSDETRRAWGFETPAHHRRNARGGWL